MSKAYGSVYQVSRPDVTPQSKPIPGKEAQMHQNAAGGFSFTLDDWKRFDRFLLIGTDGGTFYTSEKNITLDNAKVVERCVRADFIKAVDRIVEISQAGRAPKNTPALLALAIAASWGLGKVGSDKDWFAEPCRVKALKNLGKVARYGTDRFIFAKLITDNGLRGWGPTLRDAYVDIFNEMSVDSLSAQFAKYQSREGWTNKDLLRLAHPVGSDWLLRNNVFGWATGAVKFDNERREFERYAYNKLTKQYETTADLVDMPGIIIGMELAKRATTTAEIIKLIEKYRLEREMLPTEWLTKPEIWSALLPNLGIKAILRNLGNISKSGLLSTRRGYTDASTLYICGAFNQERIMRERLHPISILIAMKTYAAGHSSRGDTTWPVIDAIVGALNEAFYLGFGTIEPTGVFKRIAIDNSSSMSDCNFNGLGSNRVMGIDNFSPAELVAAMALVTAKVEPNWHICTFNTQLTDIAISPDMRLTQVMHIINKAGGGGTDCSVPIKEALDSKKRFGAFEIWTDFESWAGRGHGTEYLKQYRRELVPDAKLIGCAATATAGTMIDPNDAGMLDVVGFDSAAPSIISDFIRGAM